MPESDPARFLELAQLLHRASNLPGAKARIGERLAELLTEHHQQQEQHKAWERARYTHVEQAFGNPCHRNEQAGPPGEGWQFEPFVYHKLNGLIPCEDTVGVWFPPNLVMKAEPARESMCSIVRRFPRLSWSEKYAIAIAIHDVVYDPLKGIGAWCPGVFVAIKAAWAIQVWQLRDLDQPVVAAIVAEVVADLAGSDMRDTPATAGTEGRFSSPDLATRHRVDPDALDQRLRRWREKIPEGPLTWCEIANPRVREAKYLFVEAAVLPIIQALQTGCVGET